MGVSAFDDSSARNERVVSGAMENLLSTTLGQLIERNVLEVFGERDSERRESVINELCGELHLLRSRRSDRRSRRPECKGEQILKEAPGLIFRVGGPAEVNHDLGRTRWHFGPNGVASVVTGMDVAVFKEGRIRHCMPF
jgi:hypothetical protein